MLRTTLAGLRAHGLRLALTGLVVVLSIGFTAGTLVLTDSLDRAGTDAVAASARNVDLSVQSPDDASTYLDVSVVEAAEDIPGVASAVPRRSILTPVLGADGRPDQVLVARITAVPEDESLSGLTMTAGRLPAAADEIVLDTETAGREDVVVGDTYGVGTFDGEAVEYTVVGLADPRPAAGGGPDVSATYAATQEFADPAGATRIDVALDPRADADAVAAALREVTGTDVVTGDELSDTLVAESHSVANELRVPLLVLGMVSLIVAAFVIANTFRILVAQRTRELALLRTVGATRRQVLVGMLTESLLVGVVASVVGVLAGAVAGVLIGSVIDSGSEALPLVVSPSTVVGSLVLGVAVTVGSALLPARAATRVAPLAAVRALPDGTDSHRTARRRLVIGLALVVAGIAGLAAGIVMGRGESIAGLMVVVLGAAVCFLGVLVLGPMFTGTLVRALGRLTQAVAGRRHAATTELATANALRNPRRTAATSAALLIGVTVVAGFVTVAESVKASAVQMVDEQFPADFVVLPSAADGVSETTIEAIERADELGPAVPVWTAWAAVDELGPDVEITGLEFEAYAAIAPIAGAGEPELADDVVALDDTTAAEAGLVRGDQLTIQTAGGPATVTIGYVMDSSTLAIEGIAASPAALMAMFPESAGVAQVLVDAADGVDSDTARSALSATTEGQPGLSVQSFAERRAEVTEAVDQAVAVVLAVLGLAVVIAVIGITNTLSLSVHERTRELGLLRALGLTRRQTRGMLGVEAVLMSVVAAVVGLVVGAAFAWAAVASIADLTYTVPWAQLGACAIGAGVLGLLASWVPARRAARISPVAALATE